MFPEPDLSWSARATASGSVRGRGVEPDRACPLERRVELSSAAAAPSARVSSELSEVANGDGILIAGYGFDSLGQTPVQHDDLAESSQHDVLTLEIAVDIASRVGIGHRIADADKMLPAALPAPPGRLFPLPVPCGSRESPD